MNIGGVVPAQYAHNKRVIVHSFKRQVDGEEIIVGRPELGKFLAISPDAVELLDDLAGGATIGEAEARYTDKYGDPPATEDLLIALQEKGIITPIGESTPPGGDHSQKPLRAAHFTSIPGWLAGALFGRVALSIYGAIILMGILVVWRRPTIVTQALGEATRFASPSGRLLSIMLFSYSTIFVHEMAHLVAAHAAGVSSRLGLGRRLWFLVAETDMSGIVLVPRRQRYMPLLAGPLCDAICAAGMVLVLYIAAARDISLPAVVQWICVTGTIVYVFRLAWQCFLFMRTDFYYVAANLLESNNLMGDTEAFLRHRICAFVWPRRAGDDPLEGLREKAKRAIRIYAVVWLLGRAGAIALLVAVQLPFMYRYLYSICVALRGSGSIYAKADALLAGLIVSAGLVTGLSLWIRAMMGRLVTFIARQTA